MTLPYGFAQEGCELFIRPASEQLASGQPFTYAQDYSGKGRTLASSAPHPINAVNAAGGKSAIYFDGAANPLKTSASFELRCGWVVARVNEDSFSNYSGLLTDLQDLGILVGNNNDTRFYDFQNDSFEFRSDDQIYPTNDAPAPMNAFRLIFFRFWKPVIVNGIQIGHDRKDATRKGKLSVGLVGLFSRDFDESEIRRHSNSIAADFALALADVYPYQHDYDNGASQSSAQSAVFFDPVRGARISKVLDDSRRALDLKFSGADQKEVSDFLAFYDSHYATAKAFIYRDYRTAPPQDLIGYFDSPYQLSGVNGNFTYSFRFLENKRASGGTVTFEPPRVEYLYDDDGVTLLLDDNGEPFTE